MRAPRPSLAVLLAAFVAVPGASGAADALLFEDGRELVVEGWEIRGSLLVVDLAGGGRMALPREGVEGVRAIVEEPIAAVEESEPTVWREWAGEFADLIADSAERHRVEPVLLAAMMRIESNFDPYAVSPKGACGLLQLIPDTAERFGVADVFDPGANIDGGARYLRWLLERYEGDTRLALAAYNAGENAVDRYGDVPPYRETRDYVRKVLGKVEMFSTARPVDRVASAR